MEPPSKWVRALALTDGRQHFRMRDAMMMLIFGPTLNILQVASSFRRPHARYVAY